MTYKNHVNCRVCESEKLTEYLDLGKLPLSNNLAASTVDPIHLQTYPLKVLFCENCGLSQLSIVIPPEEMFSHYVYRSSISKGYRDHCHRMGVDLKKKLHLNENSFHVDIAGNDGALLVEFRNVIGHQVLNVDPAKNLAAICEGIEIPMLTEFWSIHTAKKILNRQTAISKSKEGKPIDRRADLITATNVFAHVDNVKEFIEAAKLLLKPTGVLVLEFPYLIDFIDNREFDTVYFEHLSYFSIYPLTLLAESVGLTVMSVEKQEIHGGSVRVTIGLGKQDESVFKFVMNERVNYSNIDKYYKFSEDVRTTINSFRDGVHKLSYENKIAGFAASAKGNTLLNCAMITVGSMAYIVDETPEKIGKYSPGTRIPIISLTDMMKSPPDYLVILSWNFKKEIMNKVRGIGYKGKFIIPIPEFEIISNESARMQSETYAKWQHQ